MSGVKRQKVIQPEDSSLVKDEKRIKGINNVLNSFENCNKNDLMPSEQLVRSDMSRKAGPVKSINLADGRLNGVQMKEYVRPSLNKCTIESVQFGVMGTTDISRAAEIEIEKRELYFCSTNIPFPGGVLDSRLGCNKSDMICETCGKGLMECVGHWGYIQLELPVFHIGFFKYTIQILYCICKKCSFLLLPEDSIRKLEEVQRKAKDDPVLKPMIFKNIIQQCKKVTKCPRCQASQGVIKRIVKPIPDQFMKLKHVVKYKEGGKMQVAEEELNPLVVRQLFQNIDPIHAKVLNIVHPERLIISSLPLPPNCIRPSVTIEGQGTTEDDLTCIFSDIVDLNNSLKEHIKKGAQTNRFMGTWQFLQLQCTRLINADAPAISQLLASKNIAKPGRGICQRLKGKEGRFRGHLSGKRVDFSARTVISPDPNVGIDEVVVPEWVARRLTFPERVTRYNINVMKRAILNGVSVWPGASYVNKIDGSKCSLRYANPKHVSENLQIGDVVERHLWNGDLVIFNRQPSLHRLSVMCHRARVMAGSTFRFNECVCLPYNADFDGDEMNLHLPQTYEARAESLHLLSVLCNLTTPRNGEPLIAPVQDFLSSSYLLTSRDRFLTFSQLCQVVSYFTDSNLQIDLPPPSILYPVTLWTGKQVFSILIKPNKQSAVMVNIRVKEREFNDPTKHYGRRLDDCMCPSDGFVEFYKSELMCGGLGSRSLGASKGGLFYELMRKNSPIVSSKCMLRVSKLSSRWLSEFGMTIGLDDVTPSKRLVEVKRELLLDGYRRVDEAIANSTFLQPFPGCTRGETLELKVKSILDELRNESGRICTSLLSPYNKPLVMFNSGAKGALINIAQMVACVGQQNVSGQRIQNGFIGRTLPHFPTGCKDAKSRGFVANSFFTGLEPEEFFFHTMSGREGLIDTAVKTSETGYMQRRLMKVMEDLCICYDHSVRTSDGQIVQFLYGDDGLSSSLSKSCVSTLKSSLEHIKHINPIDKQCVSVYIPSDKNIKFNRGRKKMKRLDKSNEDCWILPNELMKMSDKINVLIEDDEFVHKLPLQMKNKVKSYKHWLKILNVQGEKLVDENIVNSVKNHLIAYCSVYTEVPEHKRNVPLLPFEIESWVKFLQPLLVELLPPTIYKYNSINFNENIGSIHEFGNMIEMILMEHSQNLSKSLQENYRENFSNLTTSEFLSMRFKLINTIHHLSLEQIFEFIRYCWKDYQKCLCEPGEAIGALGAQSIGEPATQMTLKTFHFAGVASMNVTLGVPRIKEIINGASTIATPIIEVPLENKTDYNFALKVKSRIEKTTLGQVCSNIKQLFTPNGIKLLFTLNNKLIRQLQLEINSNKVRDLIIETGSFGKVKIGKNSVYSIGEWQICIEVVSNYQHFFQQNALISGLLQLVVGGFKNVKRAVIKRENTSNGPNYQIAVEGYGLQQVMGARGVVANEVKSNHIAEIAKVIQFHNTIFQVLGIEAARSVIISEIQKCMDAYSIDIDGRYMKLLGDVMTFRGEVVGINRFGIQKMRASTLMLASFEETNEHLFEAAVHHRKDPIKGVSECVIMGKPISLGTGSFDIMMST